MDGRERLFTIAGTTIAVGAGVLIGTLLAPSDPTARVADPSAAAATSVASELRELRQELAALRTQVENTGVRAPDEADVRQPIAAGTPSDLTAELTAWMERVETQLRLGGGDGPLEPVRLPAPGFVGQVPPRPPVDDSEGAREDFQMAHFLWTYQDVLDTYGLPDRVHIEGGSIEWEYRYEDPAVLEDHDDVHFVFSGGMCVGMVLH